MELLKESVSSDNILIEGILDENTGKKNWFIEAITLQGDITNGNNRNYPFAVLKEAVEKHVSSEMPRNRCVGYLNHPDTKAGEILPDLISHKFVSVQESGKNFVTKCKVLNTPSGQIVQNLLSEDIGLGISSRGMGNLKESGGIKVVQSYEIISLGDLVWQNSAPDAFCNAIMENKQWVYENGVLVQKDLSQELDIYKRAINEAKAKDIQKVVKSVFEDYMKKLKTK